MNAAIDAYSVVNNANNQASMIPALTQITALSTRQDVVTEYRAEVLRLSTAPYGEVVDQVSLGLEALTSGVKRNGIRRVLLLGEGSAK
jgi:hypothetical protein